jgi:ketosteroid isomerase-like protein
MTTVTDQVASMEAQLREAMLAGDLKVLGALLADDLVFTNQTGHRLTKADDLAAHSAGRLKITQIDISDQRVRPHGAFAIVTLVANVGGSFDGQSFSGRFAYTRVWERGRDSEGRSSALLSRNLYHKDERQRRHEGDSEAMPAPKVTPENNPYRV